MLQLDFPAICIPSVPSDHSHSKNSTEDDVLSATKFISYETNKNIILIRNKFQITNPTTWRFQNYGYEPLREQKLINSTSGLQAFFITSNLQGK